MNGAKLASVAIDPFPTGPPLLSTPPTIVGPPEAGQLLAAVPGLWEGGKPLTFTYQWTALRRGGRQLHADLRRGAESYRPVSDDVGHALKVVVTATSAAGGATVHDHRSDRRRHPRRHLAGRAPDQPQAAGDRRHGPGRAGPDELGRDLDRLADEVHVSLAALQRRAAPRASRSSMRPGRNGRSPPTTSARRSRSS